MERRTFVETQILSQFYRIKDVEFLQMGVHHSLKVASIAAVLASLYNESQELAYIAGLCHDCYTYLWNQPNHHAEKGALYTMQLLRESNLFHETEIEMITRAIHYHSKKQVRHDLFCQILKCADAIATNLTSDAPIDVTSIINFYLKQLD